MNALTRHVDNTSACQLIFDVDTRILLSHEHGAHIRLKAARSSSPRDFLLPGIPGLELVPLTLNEPLVAPIGAVLGNDELLVEEEAVLPLRWYRTGTDVVIGLRESALGARSGELGD